MKRADTALIAVAAALLLTAACAKRQIPTELPPPPDTTPPAATAAPAPAPRPLPPPPAPVVAAAPVEAPPTPEAYPPAATRARIDQLLASIEDAYFDYNQSTLRPDALTVLQADATELRDIMKDYPAFRLTIEGHCDERGSAEYNVALGAQRATAAKDFLVKTGIPATQLDVVSYGNQRPVCTEQTEACWQRNRRVHFVAQGPPN